MDVLGIDIGGSGIKGAPVDTEAGKLTEERLRIPTPRPSKPGEVADVVASIVKHFGWSGPVGVTFPGVVVDGVVLTAANVDRSWEGVDAAVLFGGATVLNDADAAGMAEMTFGQGRGRQGTVLVLTFGTGIGSALFTDGRLVRNTEFGHLQVRGKDAEHRASAQVREDLDLSWKAWAGRVEEYLRYVEMLFTPSLIVIGGGVSKKAGKFLPHITLDTPVVPADLRNEAGIIGAACAAAPLRS
ncbi:ROK family protein [Nonomuraea sp. KC401]|uniref:polyphosphate--glucose phosphotransferase n=1 Tax=unclassified Nonomuraea TaxID=2593643 RepID=UPI0010FE2586|nr:MULTISPECIES: ROK family protein [unclassified Nonomuraea]NBE93004.1 ROK family protein [Nonomuraea sp. K271]TLF78177.1 ROK family protein [Nonomuraea sp. KC401]